MLEYETKFLGVIIDHKVNARAIRMLNKAPSSEPTNPVFTTYVKKMKSALKQDKIKSYSRDKYVKLEKESIKHINL